MPDIGRTRANDAFRFLNSHRIFFYSLASLLGVWAVITNALQNYSNYYSVAVYLSKSSRSVLVLANFGILLTLLCGHVVQRIFFGALRPNEVERLYDRLWFFITESLLAFTIFRDEFDTPFALMFGFLLFVKSFHWLASDRIEWMDQRPYPGPPLMFHFRMNTLFVILWATDLVMFVFAVEHTLSTGVGGMVLFASEYGILVASLMNTILKYCLSTYDLRRAGRRGGENAPPWENKSMWIFYIELMTDFFKLTTYLVFFCVIIAFYGLPLNIIRDVYVTARSFITRLKALHRYQTATRNMDQRYPNATEGELTDRTCIICRDEMILPTTTDQPNSQTGRPNTTPKKLPCGHIFHFHCLKSWLERQQSCPTCRRNVLDEGQETQVAGQRANGPGEQPQQNAMGPPANAGNNVQDRNNPLGLLGRLFGVPNRILNPAPGNVPNLNNQRMVNGQHPGIFINYQVQYLPRHQNHNIVPDQLQQLPSFAGFHGPGGAWQPWPREDEFQPLPDGTTSTEGPQVNGHVSEGPTSPSTQISSTQASDKTQTPREAAAQAALRRLGGSSEIKTLPKVMNASTLSPDAVDPGPSNPTPTTTRSETRPPQLIPILDLNQPAQALQGSLLNAFQHVPSPISVASIINKINPASPGANLRQDNGSISNFPPSLSEDQLARLDTLTRESIDERLRILESVSARVNNCIDDLLRLRSALPLLDPSANSFAGDEAPSSNRGKGKEKAEDISED